ncbi:MAG: hypothetical protein K0R48_1254 [Gammaproteobacteria bacterium]|jgi:hypothetical protein|nr:hypothetical protein [Gammaproteobacteria bacterium]
MIDNDLSHYLYILRNADLDAGCMLFRGEKAEFILDINEYFSQRNNVQDVPNLCFSWEGSVQLS